MPKKSDEVPIGFSSNSTHKKAPSFKLQPCCEQIKFASEQSTNRTAKTFTTKDPNLHVQLDIYARVGVRTGSERNSVSSECY